ncbi:MAG: type 4a pilus biogenesis protein PilO [Chromatiales bacterium]|nr:type 4a pilus biogenesis protein PilO [Chromatiales bacterium]
MNDFLEQLRALDVNDIGRWPAAFRYGLIGIIFLVVAIGGTYQFVYKDQILVLEQAQQEEVTLMAGFKQKQTKAANLEAYKAQLAEIESSFGTMLRQLPGKTEVPSLLVDISQTGLAAGLDEELFQPVGEIRKEFYAELPIRIRLVGGYHELGKFVSDIAGLPRIVTLHDAEITKLADSEDLVLNVTAKTYRYLDDDEEAGS